MRNIIKIFLCSFLLVWGSSAYAEIKYGFGVSAGQVSSSGTETEGTAADTSKRSKSFDEVFATADIFVEYMLDSGLTFGVSHIPYDIDLGSGSRIDSDGDDAAENDDGTRKAEASLEDFVTLYANYPFGGGNAYALLGVHMATVATTETLPNSSYDDEDIYGLQVGVGTRNGNYKVEVSYSDFEDVNISSTGGNTNKVDADIDMLQFRVAYSF